MKTYVIIILCGLVSGSITFGQGSQLVMTKKSNQKEYYIKAGDPIRVYLGEDHYRRGPLQPLNNTTIAIRNDTIPTGKILKVVAKVEKRKKAGKTLVIVGSVSLVLGMAMYGDANNGDSGGGFSIDFSAEEEKAGLGFMALGVGMTTYGIFKLTLPKVYKRKNWDFSIRSATSILE